MKPTIDAILLKAMGSKGNLIILEGPDTIPSAAGRLRGFKDALKDAPNVKVILSKNALYARPAAGDLLKAMLKATPNAQVDGVLAANDAMALGAVDAFKEAKRPLPLITGINAAGVICCPILLVHPLDSARCLLPQLVLHKSAAKTVCAGVEDGARQDVSAQGYGFCHGPSSHKAPEERGTL